MKQSSTSPLDVFAPATLRNDVNRNGDDDDNDMSSLIEMKTMHLIRYIRNAISKLNIGQRELAAFCTLSQSQVSISLHPGSNRISNETQRRHLETIAKTIIPMCKNRSIALPNASTYVSQYEKTKRLLESERTSNEKAKQPTKKATMNESKSSIGTMRKKKSTKRVKKRVKSVRIVSHSMSTHNKKYIERSYEEEFQHGIHNRSPKRRAAIKVMPGSSRHSPIARYSSYSIVEEQQDNNLHTWNDFLIDATLRYQHRRATSSTIEEKEIASIRFANTKAIADEEYYHNSSKTMKRATNELWKSPSFTSPITISEEFPINDHGCVSNTPLSMFIHRYAPPTTPNRSPVEFKSPKVQFTPITAHVKSLGIDSTVASICSPFELSRFEFGSPDTSPLVNSLSSMITMETPEIEAALVLSEIYQISPRVLPPTPRKQHYFQLDSCSSQEPCMQHRILTPPQLSRQLFN